MIVSTVIVLPPDGKLLKERITLDPKVMTGKPVIKGTRLTVQHILDLLAKGITIEGILQEYPGLKKEDILACLYYAKEAMDQTSYFPLSTEA